MAGETQQVVPNSSTAVAENLAPANTAVSMSGAAPTSTPVVAPKGFRQVLQQMLQGWQTVVPSGSTVQSSNGSLIQADVLGKLQGYLAVYSDLDAQATALKQAHAQEKSQLPEASQYIDLLRVAVANFLGVGSPQLVQFGLQPKKPRKVMSSTTLAIRAAKARATRKLRGTVGKKAKAPIKSGPMTMQIVGAEQQGTTAASTASAGPTVDAGSPPAK